jgi:hypothetical protein
MKRRRQSLVRLIAVAIALMASLGTIAAWPAYADDPAPSANDNNTQTTAVQPAAQSAAASLITTIASSTPIAMAGATLFVGALFGSAGAIAYNRREAQRYG